MAVARGSSAAQIFASEGSVAGGPELGHIASARNLAKLNAISPAVFPLPPAMTAPNGEDIFIPEDCESPGGKDIQGGVVVQAAMDGAKACSECLLQIRLHSTVDAGKYYILRNQPPKSFCSF